MTRSQNGNSGEDALVIYALDSTNADKFTAEYMELLRAGGIDNWRRQLASLNDTVVVIKHATDIDRARQGGRIGVILGFQNAKPLEEDLGLIEVFHRLDIRIMQLTYNRRNFAGSGVAETTDEGLSSHG